VKFFPVSDDEQHERDKHAAAAARYDDELFGIRTAYRIATIGPDAAERSGAGIWLEDPTHPQKPRGRALRKDHLAAVRARRDHGECLICGEPATHNYHGALWCRAHVGPAHLVPRCVCHRPTLEGDTRCAAHTTRTYSKDNPPHLRRVLTPRQLKDLQNRLKKDLAQADAKLAEATRRFGA
jgi:hypothetical protein